MKSMARANIERNVEEVLARLERAATQVGVPTPTLVAVTKSGSVDEVVDLVSTGLISHIGENRVQMFLERQSAILAAGYAPKFHLIGSLQTNKVKYITGKVDLVQSLDSLRLAEEMEKQAAKRGVITSCLVEINSGREVEKGGILPEDAEGFLETLNAYPHIVVRGLMTMAPVTPTPEDARPYFRQTKALFDRLGQGGAFGDNPILSMGMSDTYEVATQEGATMVRIGRAFFKP